MYVKYILASAMILATTALAQTQASPTTPPDDAAALEARYKRCAKHYIPAEKCSDEVYMQLKAKDEAPLDPKVARAVKAVKEYRQGLKNSDSMQVHTAYLTDKGDLCFSIAGQNGLGGNNVSQVVYLAKDKWLDEHGFIGSTQRQQNGGYVNRWPGTCLKGEFHPKMVPGEDLTDQVNSALRQEAAQ